MFTFSVVVVFVMMAAVQAQLPCLPDQLEYDGLDAGGIAKHIAIDYTAKKYVYILPGLVRLVKDFSLGKMYTIRPDNSCETFNISTTMDPPQCVPTTAVRTVIAQGEVYKFQKPSGVYLYYSVNNPSAILRQEPPDFSDYVNYSNHQPYISDPNIFQIPGDCSS